MCPNNVKEPKRSIKKAKIQKFSHAEKGVVTARNAQGAELGSFDFSILWFILGLYIAKSEFPDGLQGPVHNWPD